MIDMRVGYFCAHEQNTPENLLKHAIAAEKNGFSSIWSSDHFHPWRHKSAQCGFAWVWLGAVGSLTHKVRMGTGVTSTSGRYNPAVTAQAFATLGRLYPHRAFLTLGTSEAMNEVPVGGSWPDANERYARLDEFVNIVHKLWTEYFVDYQGRYYSVRHANLYTRPDDRCELYVAADGARAARIAGRNADGLLTTASLDQFKRIVKPNAQEQYAGRAGRKGRRFKFIIELLVSYHPNEVRALNSCKFWKAALASDSYLLKISDPRKLDSVGKNISDDEIRSICIVGSDLSDHVERIAECEKAGFDEVVILNTSPDRELLIRKYGEKIIPYFQDKK
jgi:coenzyme F420-dependent glucose-6-phosphate dehydrogenase